MNRTSLEKLDLDVYSETLENGLRVFVIPKNNITNIYATFTTNYGAKQNEFVPIGEQEMIKVPDGIAHFLEHKVFEQKDGIDPFTFFSERGCGSNASTNSYKTTYLFDGPVNFEENINYLLDFVQSPYFTDENVEKEKGIIEQELQMYKDSPGRVSYEKSLYNTFCLNPIRYSVGGTVESIKKITKEDLYTCYNTFYHPSNMIVVISGNVDPEKTIEIIKENQSKKNYPEANKIKIKEYNEPDNVFKKEETLEMNVTIPKLVVTYKFNIKDINFIDKHLINQYFGLLCDLKFGPTTLFSEEIKKDGLINYDIGYSIVNDSDHIAVMIESETSNPELLKNKIIAQMQDGNFVEEEFNRKKKMLISSCIHMSDSIYRMNNRITFDILTYGKINNNLYNDYYNMNYNKLLEMISKINFDNYTSLTILPKTSVK